VGLLNSYTVWTDRREESPHRGFAFPSQQREADFYGEDRAELIAINKILVALDLIEIRKEMVLRTDEQGRRWRVPHNFYRVKDHADGFNLSPDLVLRVVELADREAAVYRIVRHVFSGRFAPIDADNPWARILPELRRHATWQRLATRVAAEEARAAARTRAGHATRAKRPTDPVEPGAVPPFFAPDGGARTTTAPTRNDSAAADTDPVLPTDVGGFNGGSPVDVADANRGSDAAGAADVAGSNEGAAGAVPASNNGPATAVGPLNRTYHDDSTTTTTTIEPAIETYPGGARPQPVAVAAVQLGSGDPSDAGTARAEELTAEHVAGRALDRSTDPLDRGGTAGPGERPAPADAPGELAGVRAFEDANARRATPAERQILAGLAERFDSPAGATGASGWGWVAAAIYEAVEAGSAYVAPRRIREILTRWEREGAQGAQGAQGARARGETGRVGRIEELLGAGPDLALPHGHGSRATWAFAVGLLAGAVAPERLAELVAGTAIVGYRDGEVTIAAPDPGQAERLATAYRELVSRKLSEAMRRPVRLAVLTTAPEAAGSEAGEKFASPGEPAERGADDGAADPDPAPPVFLVPECGVPSNQVWAAVIEEVVARGEVSRANVDAWLRPTALIGQGGDGAFVVGAPHELARKRIAARFLVPVRAAVAAVVGVRLSVEVVVAREWLRANNGGGDGLSAIGREERGA
jgi:hypothetical protein